MSINEAQKSNAMIRPYQKKDSDELIGLLRLNTPQYFAPSEEKDFIDYLQNSLEHYFVFEVQNKIVGCGGFNYFEEETIARISWDMVHPDFHGKGIGKQLTNFRIQQIKANPNTQTIVVRTSQLAYQFYEKIGFSLETTQLDFWAKDLHLYQMQMTI